MREFSSQFLDNQLEIDCNPLVVTIASNSAHAHGTKRGGEGGRKWLGASPFFCALVNCTSL